MAISLYSGVSGLLPVGTETFIDVNQSGVFTYHIDFDLLADGDTLECSVYQIMLTGGSVVRIDYQAFYGVDGGIPGLKGFHSDAFVNDLTDAQSLRFGFLQSAGTGRALPRKILKG